MPARPKSGSSVDSSVHLGFEAKLWLSTDELRNNMDPAEYRHVVLDLVSGRLGIMNLALRGVETDLGPDIRQNLLETEFVECMVEIPGQPFYSTQILVSFQKVAQP